MRKKELMVHGEHSIEVKIYRRGGFSLKELRDKGKLYLGDCKSYLHGPCYKRGSQQPKRKDPFAHFPEPL